MINHDPTIEHPKVFQHVDLHLTTGKTVLGYYDGYLYRIIENYHCPVGSNIGVKHWSHIDSRIYKDKE